jgi:hypothetical protein
MIEEDSGILMSSLVVNVHMCGQEREKKGQRGPSKGTQNEAVNSERWDQQGQRFTALYKEPLRLSFIFNIYRHYTCNSILCTILCMKKKKNIFSSAD